MHTLLRMAEDFKLGLSFDDVLLVPKKSSILPSDANIGSVLAGAINLNIPVYDLAAKGQNHEPKRFRKLLLHKREIQRLQAQVDQKGLTLIVLSLYFKNKENLSGSIESKVLQSWLRAEAYALNIYQTASKLMAGKKIGPESSLGKVFWSELDHQMHQTALDILGVSSELEEVLADDVASWIKGYMFSYSGPIYAGTNEIQKNIIAERLLGMPR